MTREVWIGLVGVTPVPGNNLLGKGKGAFVNALAMADSAREYESMITVALSDLGLVPHEFEDVEPFSERTSKWEVDEQLRDLAEEVKVSGNPKFGTFHNYLGVD